MLEAEAGARTAVTKLYKQYQTAVEYLVTLYEKWDRSWAEPIELHGNQIMITCEMVAGAPLDQLTNTFGATLAAHFMEVAKRNTAM